MEIFRITYLARTFGDQTEVGLAGTYVSSRLLPVYVSSRLLPVYVSKGPDY